MAFQIDNFNCCRNAAAGSATILNIGLHLYNSTGDTLATIYTASYFPANFGVTAGFVQLSDFILINASNGSSLARITNVGTRTIIEAFSSISTISVNQNVSFTGPWSTPQNTTLTYSRITYGGFNITTITVPTISANANVLGQSVSVTPNSLYHPVNAVGFSLFGQAIQAVDNNAYTAAVFNISSVNTMEIHKVPGNTFSGLSLSGPTGWSDFSTTFLSN